MIGAHEFLALSASLHHIAKQIMVPTDLPNLGMHYNRAVEPGHFVRGRRAIGRFELVVGGDQVLPPGIFDVTLEFDTQRAVLPEAIDAAVDFTRLKQKASPFAERDEFFHFHERYRLKKGLKMPAKRAKKRENKGGFCQRTTLGLFRVSSRISRVASF